MFLSGTLKNENAVVPQPRFGEKPLASNVISFVYFAYAALLVVGGGIGLIVGKSPMSLVGGAVFGLIAVFAAFLIINGGRVGLYVGLVDALAVAGFFLYRYLDKGKVMPAIPTIALSVIVIALSIIALVQSKDVPKSL